MKMRKFVIPMALLLMALVLGSCGSIKNVPYFKNSDTFDEESSAFLYDARIMPKDQLTITVSTITPEAAAPFNLNVPSGTGASAGAGAYLVDNQGYITFPVVGSLKVSGLTKSEAEQLIQTKIKHYMNSEETPIVTVRMSSYSVTVLGEVGSPGTFLVSREKINIFEALAQAGDLTIYGYRDNIKLLREDANGKKSFHTLNLNDANIVNSPYYYLQQNDIVYAEPNKVKARNSLIGASTTLWLTVLSVTMSVASFTINLINK